MLILARGVTEALTSGDNITVTILAVKLDRSESACPHPRRSRRKAVRPRRFVTQTMEKKLFRDKTSICQISAAEGFNVGRVPYEFEVNVMLKQWSVISSVVAATLFGCATSGTHAPTSTQIPAPIQAPAAAQVTLPDAYIEKGIKITVEGLWKSGTGNVLGVNGTAKNIAKRDMKFCSVMLDVLDNDGVKLATAQATITGLKVGQTWRFQATLSSPYEIRFASIKSGSVIAIPVTKPKSAVSQS